MTNIRKTLFISDLHLDENHSEIALQLLAFLNTCDKTVDAIYILGDLFEAWIGDDDDTLFNQKIVQALRAVTDTGIPIYFMYGNRDYLISKKFLRDTGCILLADEERVIVYGTPVLLMHGDTLCTTDIKYQKSRKIVRSWWFAKLAYLSPLRLRRQVANKMRAASMQHTQSAPKEIMDVTQAEVERVMLKHDVRYLIHGHTHRPAVQEFTLNNEIATRIVLPAWHGRGGVFVWDSAGNKALITLL